MGYGKKGKPIVIEQPSLTEVKSELAQIVTVNLKVTNESDITTDLKNAIATIDTNGGGILNIPYRLNGYNLVSGEIELCNNLIIKGNNNKLNIPSVATTKNIFTSLSKSNVDIHDLKFISTNDQTRVIGRSGLGSNVYGLSLQGENIKLDNLYFEGLESGLWMNRSTVSKGIKVSNIKSFKTKQPLYLKRVSDSSFSNLDLDCTDGTDSLDHQIYVNGVTNDLNFDNLLFKNGVGVAIAIKADNTTDLNQRINMTNITILSVGSGVFVANTQELKINNLNINGDIVANGYGISLAGQLNKNLHFNDFHIKGYLNSISINPNDLIYNAKFSKGFVVDFSGNSIAINKVKDLMFDGVTFKGSSLNSSLRVIYTSGTTDNEFTIKSCQFVYDTAPNNIPVSLRANDLVVFDGCQFINRGTDYSAIHLNLSPAIVICKNNYYKGFTSFKHSSDTATTEYANVAL